MGASEWIPISIAILVTVGYFMGVPKEKILQNVVQGGKGRKKVTLFAKIYIPVGLLILGLSIYFVYLTPKPSPADLQLAIDSPYIDTVSHRKLKYRLFLKLTNEGDRKACYLVDSMVQVGKHLNQYHLITDPRGGGILTGVFARNIEILGGQSHAALYLVNPENRDDNGDSLYFCVRIHYTDSVGTDGLFQKVIDMQPFETYTTLMTSGVESDAVEKFLKEKGIW